MNPLDGSLKKKTSFYYPLLLLPREKRKAMEILYRYCWLVDEVSDSSSPLTQKKKLFQTAKRNLQACLQGGDSQLFPQMGKVVREFQLSPGHLWRILRGVERDLRPVRFKTFAELRRYAKDVAGGPGLASMEIFGFKDKAHRAYAENLGVFLQIVNVVRDFREDTALGRQYLPLEDFRRFHLDPTRIGVNDSHWKPFVEFQLDRAWGFLEKARRSLARRQRSQLLTAEAITAVYVKLYQKLRNHPHQVLREKIVLSKADKLFSVAGAVARGWLWRWMED